MHRIHIESSTLKKIILKHNYDNIIWNYNRCGSRKAESKINSTMAQPEKIFWDISLLIGKEIIFTINYIIQ